MPATVALPRVAVVGAGVAGLACARALQKNGAASVVVFEKSRSYGGRCASLHWRGSVVDTGVQFFTLRSSFTRSLVRDELRLVSRDASFAAHSPELLSGELRSLPANAVISAKDGLPIPITSGHRMYHTHGNSYFARALASGLDVRLGHTVVDVHPDGHVEYQRETPASPPSADSPPDNEPRARAPSSPESLAESFDAVVCTAPLPQSAGILDSITPPEWDMAFAPNITLVLEYETHLIDEKSPARRLAGSAPLYAQYPLRNSILAWTACENAKTGRRISPGKTVMVIQASDAFSAVNFDHVDQNSSWEARTYSGIPEPAWALDLIGEMEELWKIRAIARNACFAKRWRYARVNTGSRARDISHVENPADRVFFCGDGVARRSRLEHALLNGHCAAHCVASALNAAHSVPAWSPA